MPDRLEQELPADAELAKQIGTLSFYFSKANNTFFIVQDDYHAGPVAFARSEIVDLLRIQDSHTEEKVRELMTELEQDEDDF